jgi:hypothetical protein
MGRHYAKIAKPKPKPFPGLLQNKEHDFSAHITFKDLFFVIGPGSNMICRSHGEFTFFTHRALHTPYGTKTLFCFSPMGARHRFFPDGSF